MRQICLPQPALQSFVKEFWFLDLTKGSGVPLSMSPVPEQCLYFYPKSLPIPFDSDGVRINSPDNILTGQTVRGGQKLLVPDGYCMFKILFQPSGIHRLFGIPMTLFTDRFEETILVLGNPVKELREQIVNADGFAEMVRLSEDFLLKQVKKARINLLPIDKVLSYSDIHNSSLDQLASDACLSNRQFERNFLERIGVSPKIYQRIVRFNRAINIKNKFPDKKWIDITYACGYFDQMHLLRDFRQFTHVTPSSFDFEKAVIY